MALPGPRNFELNDDSQGLLCGPVHAILSGRISAARIVIAGTWSAAPNVPKRCS